MDIIKLNHMKPYYTFIYILYIYQCSGMIPENKRRISRLYHPNGWIVAVDLTGGYSQLQYQAK